MSLNLHLLRLFTTVARTGSFSRAAEVLRISQPAISKGVRDFELQVGCRLLDRNSKGVRPTREDAPLTTFRGTEVLDLPPNRLVLQIQPSEGVSLHFEAKKPGPDVRLTQVRMDFRYADWFKAEPATGYEPLVYDVLIGDQTLFNRGEDVELGWRAVTPFLDAWRHIAFALGARTG